MHGVVGGGQRGEGNDSGVVTHCVGWRRSWHADPEGGVVVSLQLGISIGHTLCIGGNPDAVAVVGANRIVISAIRDGGTRRRRVLELDVLKVVVLGAAERIIVGTGPSTGAIFAYASTETMGVIIGTVVLPVVVFDVHVEAESVAVVAREESVVVGGVESRIEVVVEVRGGELVDAGAHHIREAGSDVSVLGGVQGGECDH